MRYDLVVRKRADAGTKKAIDYYFQISADHATRFLSELNETLDSISANPLFYKYLSTKKEKMLPVRTGKIISIHCNIQGERPENNCCFCF